MSRPECTPERLVIGILDNFGQYGEWDGSIRLKWILNAAAGTQFEDDEVVLLAIREKNKTL